MDTLLKQFIQEHREDDVRLLALQASRYPNIDMPTALTQIAGWQSIREKVPTWATCDDIIYPSHLPLEQCSSEATAIYKYGVVSTLGEHETFADLTGGFGIDCWFMSQAFQHTTYIERQEELVKIVQHNFEVLPSRSTSDNIHYPLSIIHYDAESWIRDLPSSISWLYLDPARRDTHGGKTVAISDCEPDVSALEETLVQKAGKVIVKLSPMLDLDLALHQLKHVQEAHIVSVDHECKELLLLLDKDTSTDIEVTPIHCINIKKEEVQAFTFTKIEEQQANYELAKSIGLYLYEPNASILKAGAYRCLANRYGLQKLHANSHLYTSDKTLPNFPGRMLQVEAVSGFGKKELKTLLSELTKANLTVRNFPASVAELRKRLHLSEGGDTYLFVTTLNPDQKIIIKCKK
jgi:hypothetical protein